MKIRSSVTPEQDTRYQHINIARTRALARKKERTKMRKTTNHRLSTEDYPDLARQGFITFRRRPGMTRKQLDRNLRRQNWLLNSYGYLEVAATLNPLDQKRQRCGDCNYCIITGLSNDGKYTPFSHWCFMTGCPVCPDGGCPQGRSGWGPVVQLIRGRGQ